MSRIKHSVCRWCYGDIPLENLCVAAKSIGISSVELVMPDDMPVLEKHGLSCAMISFPVAKKPSTASHTTTRWWKSTSRT